jgi:PAS domain S-box-containing protein
MKSHEYWSVFGREQPAAHAPPDLEPFPGESVRALLDALPAAIYATDVEGRLTYFNSAAAELSGRTPELGTDRWCVSWRLYRADGTLLTHAECPMAVSLREGRPIRGEELLVERPDGTRIACMPYPTPLRRADGTIIGGINLLVDISDRKRAEEDLRDSEERFIQFMHNLPGLAWIKDRQGRYVYANEAAERAFATGLGDLLGRTDQEIFTPATAAEFAANDRRVLDSERGIETIETLEHGDGAVHHSIVSKFPIPGRDGTTKLIGGVAIDVTELKQTEEALRRSEAWFRTLAEASPALIWRLDPAGEFNYVNPPYLEYFGRHEDEVLDRGWFPLLHPDDAGAYMASVDAAQRERRRLQAAVRVRHRHGDWRWIESYALPLFSDGGEYLGHIGTSLDITERKQVEEALSEADSRKDEFLAMLAHELRGPLAPIRNSIEIMRRTAAPETESVVKTLDRQVNHLVRLVDDLLDVGRISRGRIELRRERLDIRSVVQHAVEAVAPLCDDLDQTLTVDLPTDPAFVDGDPARLAQVLGNLLSNASKFTPRGGRLSIAVNPQSSSPAHVVIRVCDTGIGIAPEQFARIFDLFMQIDTSLERVGGGLGIGLTLVRTLVGMHGGTVEVRSEGVGRGSEFFVRLPRLDPLYAPAKPHFGDVTTAHAPRRVLVVDDNRDSADSLCALLRLGGHEAVAAYDGLEAVDAAAAFRPEVILLDIGLPKLNGFEVARRIRQREGDACPVLVALTGWGQDSDRKASREAGFDAHLVKPVDDATLARLLADLGTVGGR